MTHPALYLDRDKLLQLLNPTEALGAVQDFFASHGREQVAVPTRIHLPVPGVNTMGLYMPAATASYVGVKIVHLMPERRPAVEAEVFLYDAETGKLLFWGDGKPLTALRTAAVSTAATVALRKNLGETVVFGAGVQAAAHIEAFRSAYPDLKHISVVARSPESFTRLQGMLSEESKQIVQLATDTQAVVKSADCIVATTPAGEPLFDWADVTPDVHVVGIGSATPAMNELPPETFAACQVWLDTEAALKEAGDCLKATEQGWDGTKRAGDLFDLLGGNTQEPSGQPTLFKSVGHAAQDLAILVRLWERAQDSGLVDKS